MKLFGYGEGFYGRPHDWEDREFLVDWLASHELNTYVYGPKNDPWHRDRWRDPYPDAELAKFESLARRCADAGVEFVYAIAPYGMTLSDEDEFERIKSKLLPFVEMGLEYFALLWDDVPERLREDDQDVFSNLGEGHRHVTERLWEWLDSQGARLATCPVEYTGLHTSPYLESFAEIPAEIPIAWTGRGVFAAALDGEEIATRAESLGHPVIVWDNYPVNDGPMGIWLHMGPYVGRDSATLDASAGLFLNGMSQARASAVALAQLGDLIRLGEKYDPHQSWMSALEELGSGAPEAFACFAEQVCDSVCYPQPSPTLSHLLGEAEAATTRKEIESVRGALLAELERQNKAVTELRSRLRDQRLLAEISPWLDQMAANVTAMLAAVRGWAAIEPEVTGGRFQMEDAFGLMAGELARRRAATGDLAVHGCSFGMRALFETVDGGWRLEPGALVKGESQVERCIELVIRKVALPRSRP